MVAVDGKGPAQLWDRGGYCELMATLPGVDGLAVSGASFGPLEHGSLVATRSGGSAQVWTHDGGEDWRLAATLALGEEAATDVAFSPGALGLLLAVARDDGHVRVYESAKCWGIEWELVADLACCASRGSAPRVSWEPTGASASLTVSAGEQVQIWRRESAADWVLVEQLACASPIASLACAPCLERLACATRRGVVVFSLAGDDSRAAAPLRLDPHRAFDHVVWNGSGSLIAAVADDGETAVWKRDFFKGTWTRVQSFAPLT